MKRLGNPTYTLRLKILNRLIPIRGRLYFYDWRLTGQLRYDFWGRILYMKSDT